MKNLVFAFFLLAFNFTTAQDKISTLKEALLKLANDPQLKHAQIGFTLFDADNDTLIYTKNGEVGLQGASTQKIITAISAYETLGNNFTYETPFYFNSNAKQILVRGSYDPTLGSFRYKNTQSDNILDSIINKLKNFKINSLKDVKFITNNNPQSVNQTSKGWIVEDIGNYYGAPCYPVNWRENKYEINLEPIKENDFTKVKSTTPFFMMDVNNYINEIKVDKIGSGDNSCNYNLQNGKTLGKGTIGLDLKNFESGVSIAGDKYLMYNLFVAFNRSNANILNTLKPQFSATDIINKEKIIYVHRSPTLDSINYWFLKKSINIYGESLLRTLGQKVFKNDDYNFGIYAIHQTCKQIKVDTGSVHIFDGCGLSPQNRITTNALCKFMQFARTKSYYKQFYNCLPIINDISMKSGSIHGTRAYTGYISSSNNYNYTFAIIVNNFEGSGKDVQAKLWKVLDTLK